MTFRCTPTTQSNEMVNKKLTVDAAATRLSFYMFVMHGVPLETLESVLGLTKEQLDEPDRRIPFISHHLLIKKGIELTEPAIALKIGAKSTPEGMGIVGHILRHCGNLEEAGHQLIRYFKLFFGMVEWKLEKKKNSAAFQYHVKNPNFYMRFGVEVMLSSALSLMRSLTGNNFIPKEIRFRYKKPEYVAEYNQLFRAPLKFNQSEDAIILLPEQLRLPIPEGQSYVKDILQKHANNLLANVETDEDLKNQVRQILSVELPTGVVDIDSISEKLQMSRWTLTRKLKGEGTTFKRLLRDSREKLAVSYLSQRAESIEEIAFLLGYSEASAFQRAFKGWVGQTPLEYRLAHATS